jgi:pimeloyl-ACP methyl ester carboxylesterase
MYLCHRRDYARCSLRQTMDTVLLVGGFGATLGESYEQVPSLLKKLGRLKFYELSGGIAPRRHADLLRKWIAAQLCQSKVKCIVAHSMGTVALLLAAESPELRKKIHNTPIILSHGPLSAESFARAFPEPLQGPLARLVTNPLVASALSRILPLLPGRKVPCSRVVGGGSPTRMCDVNQGLGFAFELLKRTNEHGVVDWYKGLRIHGIAGRDDEAVIMNQDLWKHMRYVTQPLTIIDGGHRPFRVNNSGKEWANTIYRIINN